jgi:hypothetical protein
MPDISDLPMQRNHPLFRRFAIDGTVALSVGPLPTPYFVFDGHGVLIMGQAEPQAVACDFADQDVFPIATQSGKAAMALFVCSFTDASLGPHLELQAVALCAPTPDQRISDDPTAIAAALISHPEWGLLSLHLWNDSSNVVAYNSEYLGLGAELASGDVALGKDFRFVFQDAKGAPLISGQLARKGFSDLRCVFSLMRSLGLHTVLRMARQPFALAHLVNRKSAVLARNGRAQTITSADQMVVTRFAAKRDHLVLSGPLATYGFTPLCYEHISPFRFVYLHPDCAPV